MDFGNNLRNLRVQRKITQQKLADDLGLAQSTIGAYETNDREPNFRMIQALADYFEVSPYSLLPFGNDSEKDLVIQYGEIVIGSQKLREIISEIQTFDNEKLNTILAVARSIKS